MVEISDFKSEYVIPRNVSIWLPPGYASDGEGFPVLYMHDGQNLFDSTKAYIGAEWGVDEWISKSMAGKTTGNHCCWHLEYKIPVQRV
ncbi:MAG: alpha/beta hydrolase-fold protein [Bacteroidales bacterium]